MSGNGHPSWEDDFPMQQEAEDYAGRVRTFAITCHEGPMGFSVRAVEEGREGDGYEFAAFNQTNPYSALGRVRNKIRHSLATRHITGSPGSYSMLHDTLRGRITWGEVDGTALIVDGVRVSMENLASMLATHEGWEVELKIVDALA